MTERASPWAQVRVEVPWEVPRVLQPLCEAQVREQGLVQVPRVLQPLCEAQVWEQGLVQVLELSPWAEHRTTGRWACLADSADATADARLAPRWRGWEAEPEFL